MQTVTSEEIGRYYDRSQKWCRLLVLEPEGLALHYGFWDGPVTKAQAVTQQYREIAERLNIQPGQKILDAGCGVGGASLWLAPRTEAHFTGISVSQVHVHDAQRYAMERGITGQTEFLLADYTRTPFPDNHFDSVFGIESFCHAYPDPRSLYREMWRVLKPGGRMLISDGVIAREPETAVEQKWTEQFCYGFRMSGWCSVDEIQKYLAETGFTDVQSINQTPRVRPTVDEMWRLFLITLPLHLLRPFGFFGVDENRNSYALYSQKKLYDAGIVGYYTFVATKPL